VSINLGDALVYLGANRDKLDRDLGAARRETTSWLSSVGMGVSIAIGDALVTAVGRGIQRRRQPGQVGAGLLRRQPESHRLPAIRTGQHGRGGRGFGPDVAQNVWKNNFGADVMEAAATVRQVRQQLAGLNAEGIQGAAQMALALRDAYGPQTQDTIDAARTFMEDFNLTYQQAFDFIAAGYQRGLDRSGDFLDSITEYAPQFHSAQAGADQFF
jgi:hypothetical protein